MNMRQGFQRLGATALAGCTYVYVKTGYELYERMDNMQKSFLGLDAEGQDLMRQIFGKDRISSAGFPQPDETQFIGFLVYGAVGATLIASWLTYDSFRKNSKKDELELTLDC
ncbi:MAG: hypothetical protein WAZ18_01230 [Alphaproteobacteria bacterium]